jgi:disulfide bond formation protein DsbB
VTALARARWLAFLLPTALMAGALGSEVWGGLFPCEMCHWQRWPHYAAIGLAVLALVLQKARLSKVLVVLAALAILVSGIIGAFHAGVEYGWWEGLTRCATIPAAGGGDLLTNIMKAPLIRCDEAAWTLGGISLAGYNALLSIGGVFAIFSLLSKPKV